MKNIKRQGSFCMKLLLLASFLFAGFTCIGCKQTKKHTEKEQPIVPDIPQVQYYSITVANIEHGNITIKEKARGNIIQEDELKRVTTGTVISISAKAHKGYKLISIKVNDKTYNSDFVEETITKDTHISCTIQENIGYSLTISPLEHGRIVVKNSSTDAEIEGEALKNIADGTALIITAIAEEGYKVSSITIDGQVFESKFAYKIETKKMQNYTIEKNITVSANFAKIVTYSFKKEPLEHGRIIVTDYQTKTEITDEELESMPEKAIVRVELKADEGWEEEELEITGSASKDVLQTIVIDKNMIAKGTVYKAGQSYKIEVTPPQNGKITITNKETNAEIAGEALKSVMRGTACKIFAEANDGYLVESLIINGQAHQEQLKELTVKQDITVSANIIAKPITQEKYSIIIEPQLSHGKIEVIRISDNSKLEGDALTQIEKNTFVLIRAIADDGYKVENITVDGTIYNMHEYRIKITKSIVVSAKIFQFNDEELIPMSLSSAIIGKDPDYQLTDGNFDWAKGCFRAGRNVRLSPYKIGRFEVTWGLWNKVCEWGKEHGYKFNAKGQKGGGDDNNYRVENHTDSEPVTKISHWDATVWCNAYTEMTMGEEHCVYFKEDKTTILKDARETVKKEGKDVNVCEYLHWNTQKKGYRLPTEAEWECAARWCGVDGDNIDKTNTEKYGDIYFTRLHSASGAKLPVPSIANELPQGKTWEELKQETLRVSSFGTWFNGTKPVRLNGEGANLKWTTLPVGVKDANALGLYDMSGNVWEWVYDWHHDKVVLGDFTDPYGPEISNLLTKHVIKSGHGDNMARVVATGRRIDQESGFTAGYLGFRIAKSE